MVACGNRQQLFPVVKKHVFFIARVIKIDFARFKTVTLLMEEIGNGGVDAAVSDSAVVAHYAKNNSDKGYKLIKLDGFDVENYGFAMRPGDTETAAKLNDALKKIKENGEYAKIESKYFAQ